MSFSPIDFCKKSNHNTVIRWVKQVGNQLPDSNKNYRTPEVGQLDELPTFIGKKKQDLDLDCTRVEGENSRLRHYLARLHRKTFCYSRV